MRKTKPRYSVGTHVYHTSEKKWCEIVDRFISDYADGRFYEWRYYVKHSNYVWSVPERFLVTRKPLESTSQNLDMRGDK